MHLSLISTVRSVALTPWFLVILQMNTLTFIDSQNTTCLRDCVSLVITMRFHLQHLIYFSKSWLLHLFSFFLCIPKHDISFWSYTFWSRFSQFSHWLEQSLWDVRKAAIHRYKWAVVFRPFCHHCSIVNTMWLF